MIFHAGQQSVWIIIVSAPYKSVKNDCSLGTEAVCAAPAVFSSFILLYPVLNIVEGYVLYANQKEL